MVEAKQKQAGKMIIILDTNIIFSALVNTHGNIGDLLLNSGDVFSFYSCSYMRFEIEKHWSKLMKVSGLTDMELRESQYRLYTRISFFNEEMIPAETWLFAENLVSDIDIDDIDFIAINEFLEGNLWTGDKVLYTGLKGKAYNKVLNTNEMLLLRNNLRQS